MLLGGSGNDKSPQSGPYGLIPVVHSFRGPRNAEETRQLICLKESALVVARQEEFQKIAGLRSGDEVKLFLDLLEEATWGVAPYGGLAGLADNDGEIKLVMGLRLKSNQVVIAHELFHFAREAIGRIRSGYSRFKLEYETRSMWSLKKLLLHVRLVLWEESVVWAKTIAYCVH